MEPGRVIEFIEGGRFLTGVVTRIKGSRLNILSETDREMSIPGSRAMHETSPGLTPGKPRDDLVRALREISERRQKLADTVDIAELWELLEGEGEEFRYDYLADLVWTDGAEADHVAAMLRAVFADGLYFKMRPDTAERHDEEKVERINQARAAEEERERVLAEGGAWLSEVWADEPGDEPESRDRVIAVLRDMAVHGQDSPDYKWGRQLMDRAGIGGDPLYPFHLLVKLGEMGPHENLDLERYQIDAVFSPEALEEAERLSHDMSWQDEPRKDLTHLKLITADSGGARDFDDAVSIQEDGDRITLGVHIADVSALVKPGSLLDETARNRATSIYMPDRRITMLPEALSEESLSLREGEVRPAFSMLAELTEEGEVAGFDFFASLVTVRRQLTYQEVDAAVDSDLELGRMHRLGQKLKEARVRAGALLLPVPKLNVYITPEGEIGVNLTQWENPGRSMISEFMILANRLAARYLAEREASGMYRTQGEPSKRLVEGEFDSSDLYTCLMQRRFLNRVLWRLEPKPHVGMGLDMYTNLTSPLRRYIDLIIQRQVRALSQGGPPVYTAEVLEESLTRLVQDLKKATTVQNRRRRYWLLRYLEGAGRKDYEGLVLERLPHRYRLFLLELGLDIDLPLRKGMDLTPKEMVMLRIKKVNPREDVLQFDLV